jgi:cell division septum initiation protein DivIVA
LIKSTTRRCQEEDADRLYEQAKAQSEALIQRSKKLALSIVANARAEAQEILNEAREMSTVIFEKAREEGYQKGLALGEEKSAYLVESAEPESNITLSIKRMTISKPCFDTSITLSRPLSRIEAKIPL